LNSIFPNVGENINRQRGVEIGKGKLGTEWNECLIPNTLDIQNDA